MTSRAVVVEWILTEDHRWQVVDPADDLVVLAEGARAMSAASRARISATRELIEAIRRRREGLRLLRSAATSNIH